MTTQTGSTPAAPASGGTAGPGAPSPSAAGPSAPSPSAAGPSAPGPSAPGPGALSPGPAAPPGSAETARFFPGQLVGPDDLSADQVYARERLRRHNRLLHGWGVVCGAGVGLGSSPGTVVVGAGLVLGPWGDEIWIEDDVVLDVCSIDADGNLAVLDPAGDPTTGAGLTPAPRQAGEVLHLAVRAVRVPTAQVRVPGSLCGCDDGASEYTRLRDGYVFAALDRLPDAYDPMLPPDVRQAFGPTAAVTPCPSPPRDPWVILADATMRGPREIAPLDLYTRRRHVAAWHSYYFLDQPRLIALNAPASVANSTPFSVTVTLDGPAPEDMPLTISSEPPIVPTPAPAPTLPRGQVAATFQIATESQAPAPVQVTVTVSTSTSSVSAVVTAQPGPVG